MVQAGRLMSIEEALAKLGTGARDRRRRAAASASGAARRPTASASATGPSPFELDRAKKAGCPQPPLARLRRSEPAAPGASTGARTALGLDRTGHARSPPTPWSIPAWSNGELLDHCAGRVHAGSCGREDMLKLVQAAGLPGPSRFKITARRSGAGRDGCRAKAPSTGRCRTAGAGQSGSAAFPRGFRRRSARGSQFEGVGY